MKKIIFVFIILSAFTFFKPIEQSKQPEKTNAFAAVQTASGVGTGTTTVVVTISSSGANNLLVVSLWYATGVSFVSLTDNLGTSYTSSSAVTTASGISIVQSFAVVASGVTSVTVTYDTNVGAGGTAGVIVDEFSGNATSSVYDIRGTGFGTGTSLATSIFTPSASGKLIVATVLGYLANVGGWTAGSGYTLYGQRDYAGYPLLRTQYKLSGTTSETAPATVSYAVLDEWAEIATAFNQFTASTNTTNFFYIPKP